MRKVVVLFCFLVLWCSSVAFAKGPYVSGQLGMAFMPDVAFESVWSNTSQIYPALSRMRLVPGIGLGVAGGYDFGTVRLEEELGYQYNRVKQLQIVSLTLKGSGYVSCSTILLNGYYDFHNSTPFTPFVSAGVGVANVAMKDLAVEKTDGYERKSLGTEQDNVFAYQAGLGVGYAVSDNVIMDFKYRYLATATLHLGPVSESDFSSHNLYLGLRFNF
jgi:opacity protein-like surface antigen